MKVQFTRDLQIVPDWNGNKELPPAEQIVVRAKPFTTAQFFQILDELDSSLKDAGGAAGPDGKIDLEVVKQRFNSIGKLTMASTEILVDRVKEITNLEDTDGSVGIKEVVESVYYFGLATQILMSILDLSRPSEDDEKNSKGA